MFARKLYSRMLEWKSNHKGRSALLIKGARRVGKSTLALEFAKKEYESYLLIDFSVAPREVHEIFRDISDLNYMFLRLQLLYGVNLIPRKSAIIFDEVQKEPLARQAIKHLVADGRYDYIETGSLLSIKRNVKDIIIPSEETRLTLLPLDYEEFCNACGDNVTVPLVRDAFENSRALGDPVNYKLMRNFRLYMLVGGMPQAVSAYIETHNLSMVDAIKRNIIELYRDDFRKVDPTGRAGILFSSIPAELSGGNRSRYRVSTVIEGEKSDRVSEIIADIEDSMTVNIAWHANSPSAGMALTKNPRKYKLYLSDTGLFATLAFMDRDFTDNEIYGRLLSDKLNSNLGYMYENAVAQMLKANGHELYYYSFPRENSNSSYEIDFILARKNKICPIEVKSSGYTAHASLDNFSRKFSQFMGEKYLVYTKDLRKDKDTVCLPVYMVPFLR